MFKANKIETTCIARFRWKNTGVFFVIWVNLHLNKCRLCVLLCDWSLIKCVTNTLVLRFSHCVIVSYVLELLSSGRMLNRKWNWPESLVGFRQPFPVPTHATLCQLMAQPRPPWEKKSTTSSGKYELGLPLPLLWSQKNSHVHKESGCVQ